MSSILISEGRASYLFSVRVPYKERRFETAVYLNSPRLNSGFPSHAPANRPLQ